MSYPNGGNDMEATNTTTVPSNALDRAKPEDLKTLLQKVGDDLGAHQLTVSPDGQLVVRLETVNQPGVWDTYVRPALPYVATFGAGAALGVLGAMYFFGDDEEDATL